MIVDPVNPTVASGESGAGRRRWVRAVVLLVVLAGAVAGFYLSPARGWLGGHDGGRRALAGLGIWAYPVCVLGVAIAVPCGAPRLLLAALGAMVLGFWWG